METLWYYASANERKGPVSESALLAFHRDGAVKDSDLVWTEGMADWVPFSASPLASKAQPNPAAAQMNAAMPPPAPLPASPYSRGPATEPAQQAPLQPVPEGISGWMKFNGVMLIIQGAMACFGCITIVIGAPMIIAGAACYGAADILDNVGGVSPGIRPFLDKMRTMNLWFGIYHIIMLCLVLLYFLFMLIFGAAMIAGFSTLVEQAGKGGMP